MGKKLEGARPEIEILIIKCTNMAYIRIHWKTVQQRNIWGFGSQTIKGSNLDFTAYNQDHLQQVTEAVGFFFII